MRFGGIVLSAAIVTLSFALMSSAFSASLFFDADNDHMADAYLEMIPGETVVLSLYLAEFSESTGSFQFDMYYDDTVLLFLDYDAYMGQPISDPGLGGPVQTAIELGAWGTSQWSDPVTQESFELTPGIPELRVFYTAGSLDETASGDGEIAYVVFQASAPGQTVLDLQMPGETWYLEGTAEQPNPIDLQIKVVPEPCSSTILSMGILSLLAGAARSRIRDRRGD